MFHLIELKRRPSFTYSQIQSLDQSKKCEPGTNILWNRIFPPIYSYYYTEAFSHNFLVVQGWRTAIPFLLLHRGCFRKETGPMNIGAFERENWYCTFTIIRTHTCFHSSSASLVRPRIFARSEMAIAQL